MKELNLRHFSLPSQPSSTLKTGDLVFYLAFVLVLNWKTDLLQTIPLYHKQKLTNNQIEWCILASLNCQNSNFKSMALF